jgi:hypothetical protein
MALGVALAILVAACSGSATQAPGNGGQAPTISLASPQNGAQVTIPFDVRIDASVPLGDPATGNHHAHLYFDTNTDAADYDIVYGTTAQVTRPLAPGPHTIIVALANPDHSLAGASQTVNVTVGPGGSGAPAGSAAPLVSPSTPGLTY